MSGSPFKQFFLTLGGILALGIILFSFTRPNAPVSLPSGCPPLPSSQKNVPTFLSVKCAHKPEELHIYLKNGTSSQMLHEGPLESLNIEEMIEIPQFTLDHPPVTIIVKAKWPNGTPNSPISISLEPDNLSTRSITQWSTSGSLHNTYLFSW